MSTFTKDTVDSLRQQAKDDVAHVATLSAFLRDNLGHDAGMIRKQYNEAVVSVQYLGIGDPDARYTIHAEFVTAENLAAFLATATEVEAVLTY
ncbi:hypothetical protein [Paraburkholderia sediminicola]|uniref:hypothetical protein n=1 Tax=Paraburkholderia sediminicola TaxID=458836 RepID=UPI0038BDC867